MTFSSHHACSHHIVLQVHITFRGAEGVMWLPQRGSIHESQGAEGDKLYSVNWAQDQEAAGVQEEPLVSRFSSYEAPLGGVAPLPTSENRALVLRCFLFFFVFWPCSFYRKNAMRVWHVKSASTSVEWILLLVCLCLFLLVLACLESAYVWF